MILNMYNNHILMHVLTKFEPADIIISVTVGPRSFVLTLNFTEIFQIFNNFLEIY